MFFATPHRNSDQTVTLSRGLQFRGLLSSSYMKAVQREVDSVANLNSEFRRQLSKYQVFNFCETLKSDFGFFKSGLVKLKLDSNNEVTTET